MHKILFLSLLFFASSTKPMEKLKPEDKATLQDRIRSIHYVLGYIGSKTFAGTASQDPFVRKQSGELERILTQNNIDVPEEKTFDWLESLRRSIGIKD